MTALIRFRPYALCTALLGAASAADAASPWSLSGHFDLDAMQVVGGGAGHGYESSALAQWGGSLDAGAWLPGGTLEFSVEGVRAWGEADAGTGVVQIPSNNWAPDFLRVYQLTWRQDFGGVVARAGIMDLNLYFEASDQAALLHNSSFGMSPDVMANLNGPSFPNPGLGAMVEGSPGSGWVARGGLWQGDPPSMAGALSHGGLAIVELERDWSGAAPDAPGSDLRLGAWHYRQPDFSLGATTSGVYLVGQHRWRTGARHWGAFVMGGSSPSQGNQVRGFAAAGLLLDAPFATRPQDQASIGVARVNLAAGRPETIVEAVYSWQVTPSLALQPDVQWVSNPGGVHPDAWLAGARLHVTF